ncbi:MAG: hypothetical protein JWL77_5315 [Chthonomonadaceae bacterium]|nr:hypothetical protein [Chthonomonadaceae bacterium]
MDCRLLTGDHLDLSDYRLGTPQQAGSLTVVPITAQHSTDLFLPPTEADGVGYHATTGTPMLLNRREQGCILAPLHLGIPVERSKSYVLSHTTLLARTERLDLAREIPFPSQPSRRTRFDTTQNYVLPLTLRGRAWRVRRSTERARLTPELNALQIRLRRLGLGTLEAAVQARTPQMHCLSRQIELLSGQTGALFFIDDQPVGLEIAPSPAFFAALWPPLLLGCYGLTALLREQDSPVTTPMLEPYSVSRLTELRTEMFRARHQRQEKLEAAVTRRVEDAITIAEEQRWRNYRVQSLTGTSFAGQYVEEVLGTETKATDGGAMPKMLRNLFRKAGPTEETTRKRVVYVSLFAMGG